MYTFFVLRATRANYYSTSYEQRLSNSCQIEYWEIALQPLAQQASDNDMAKSLLKRNKGADFEVKVVR